MKIERRIWNRRKSTTISDNDKIQQNILRQLKEIEEMKEWDVSHTITTI